MIALKHRMGTHISGRGASGRTSAVSPSCTRSHPNRLSAAIEDARIATHLSVEWQSRYFAQRARRITASDSYEPPSHQHSNHADLHAGKSWALGENRVDLQSELGRGCTSYQWQCPNFSGKLYNSTVCGYVNTATLGIVDIRSVSPSDRCPSLTDASPQDGAEKFYSPLLLLVVVVSVAVAVL